MSYKILFIANLKHHLQEQIGFAKMIKEHMNIEALFVIQKIYNNESLKHIENNGFSYFKYGKYYLSKNRYVKYLSYTFITQILSLLGKFLKFVLYVMNNYGCFILAVNIKYFKLKIKSNLGRYILNNYLPNVIISSGDRPVGIEAVFLPLAKEFDIPVLVPKITGMSKYESLIKYRNKKRLHNINNFSSRIRRFLTKNYSSILYNDILFHDPIITTAYKKNGSLSSNPWVIGSGLASKVCLGDLYEYNDYLKDSVSEQKLLIIGNQMYDNLFKAFSIKKQLKRDYMSKYKLENNSKVILVALPQFFEHGMLSRKKHFQEIRFLADTISKTNTNVLISLHPKMDYLNYLFLENEYNFKILEERLYDVLPIADLFISTFSSTIHWSVLCGINYITVDFYNLNYKRWNYLETRNIISDKSVFYNEIISNLKVVKDFTNDWKSLSREIVFDGKTAERYKKIILSITKGNNIE